MRRTLRTVLITGGAGFIGSEVARQAVAMGLDVAVIDTLTYAADLQRLGAAKKRLAFHRADIVDLETIDRIFRKIRPRWVIHLAAETHVDRSILDAAPFLKTNVLGTHALLEASRRHGVERFVHVSTDEVYGETKQGATPEDSPLRPNSPYAASKAAADLLARTYLMTYSLPVLIVRPSNNYGPWQYPEKLMPVVIYKALKHEAVPVYAKGLNAREWLYVADCAEAILFLLRKGKAGEIYNVGSGCEQRNIDVVRKILGILKRPPGLIRFVKDRPGHDFRYALDFSKIKKLGWRPRTNFEEGLLKTVSWYRQHSDWLEAKVDSVRAHWKRTYRR